MKKLNVNVNGNKKLVNNEYIRFMIWNLPAQKTCPFQTHNCAKFCYARKAEKCYPNVLSSREKNYDDSLEKDFVSNMIYTIEKELNSKKFIGKKCVFRIHESGDFYNVGYVYKWIDIANHFKDDNRIVFLAYTKSIIYFINAGYRSNDFPKNLIIRSSIWDDTRKDLLSLTESFNFPIYTALSACDMEKEKQAGRIFEKCECLDCGTCKKCWDGTIKNIICEIH